MPKRPGSSDQSALTLAQVTFPKHPVGSMMHVRVRTVSAKGPSPWGDAVTGMVL